MANIKDLTLKLRKLIESADLKGIRNFCKSQPLICKEVARQFSQKYPNPSSEINRLLEALQNVKEGALAHNQQEMLSIMKRYIPADQNLRNFEWYRKQLGGAWLLWKLEGPWTALLPDGLIWSRAWICPLGSRITPAMYPVPDLAFAPWSSQQLVRCEQVVELPGGIIQFMPGSQFAKLSDKEKIAIGKAPVDMRRKNG